MFKLLLPELNEQSNQPLHLLMALVAISPAWSWGSSFAISSDSEGDNTKAR